MIITLLDIFTNTPVSGMNPTSLGLLIRSWSVEPGCGIAFISAEVLSFVAADDIIDERSALSTPLSVSCGSKSGSIRRHSFSSSKRSREEG